MKRRGVRALALVAALLAFAYLLVPEPVPPEGGWMAAAGLQAETANVDGVELRFVRRGQGPALLLLHGFASSIYTWKDVIGPLAETREVVAVDLPGFGQSAIPDPADPNRYPDLVLGLLDRLGIARASVMGNSLGGALAVVMAARHPARVERLVLVDAAGFNFAPADRPPLLRLLASPLGATLELLPARRSVVQAGLRQVFHDDSRVTRDRVDAYVRPFRRKGAVRAARQVLVASDRLGFPEVIGGVRAPTLVVWGREDAWIPMEHASRFARAIPGARVEVLDACGHMPQEERPAELVVVVDRFLR